MRKLLILISLFLFVLNISSEEVSIEKEPANKVPMKAAALSMFIPAGGQFYNESYWKASGVLALEGSLIGLAIYHHLKAEDYYKKFEPNSSPFYYSQYVKFYNKRQSDFWWLGTVIFLSTIDAYVDAHLFNFEENKNRIHLKFEDNMLSLQYNF
jgi:Family of unknown function (DUF5683)